MGGMDEAGGLLKEKKRISLKDFKACMFEVFEMSKQKSPELKG